MTDVDLQPGDWVEISAKVLELHPNGIDVCLELFSKTDQYRAFVRKDLVTTIVPAPIPPEPGDDEVVMVDNRVYQRIGGQWRRAGSVNPYTWLELCQMDENPTRLT